MVFATELCSEFTVGEIVTSLQERYKIDMVVVSTCFGWTPAARHAAPHKAHRIQLFAQRPAAASGVAVVFFGTEERLLWLMTLLIMTVIEYGRRLIKVRYLWLYSCVHDCASLRATLGYPFMSSGPHSPSSLLSLSRACAEINPILREHIPRQQTM